MAMWQDILKKKSKKVILRGEMWFLARDLGKMRKHFFYLICKNDFFSFFFFFHIALGGMNTEFEDPSSNIANFQFLCYKKH